MSLELEEDAAVEQVGQQQETCPLVKPALNQSIRPLVFGFGPWEVHVMKVYVVIVLLASLIVPRPLSERTTARESHP